MRHWLDFLVGQALSPASSHARRSLACGSACPTFLLLLIAFPVEAAILRGYVVEHASGKVLARTLVAIQPLPGSTGPTMSVRSNSYGVFEFINIPAGAYLVNASRRGFAPVHYGQKRWNAPGTPVMVEQDQTATISIRMPRYGSITGYIVDENDVGMPEHEVIAYRNTRPPRPVGKYPTDDRGWFRLWGLEPGMYLVRTAGRRYEDGDYFPTFFRETMRVEEGTVVQVGLDQDTPDVRIRPFPGKLMDISGGVTTCYPGQIVTLTFVSDMGRETTTTGGPFAFYARPPGNYEIYAEARPDRRQQPCGAYAPIALDNRDIVGMTVPMMRMADISFTFDGIPGGMNPNSMRIQARRKDIAGESEPQNLALTNGSAPFNPGRWELRLAPSSGYVAVGFSGPRAERPESGRADGWNEILVRGSGSVRWTLSDKPGSIHGVVKGPGHDIVPGAPVMIEAWDPVARRRVIDLRTVRADVQGRYQFYGLAPGTYRILSTLDVESPDSAEIETLYPQTIKVEEGRDYVIDLDLSVMR